MADHSLGLRVSPSTFQRLSAVADARAKATGERFTVSDLVREFITEGLARVAGTAPTRKAG